VRTGPATSAFASIVAVTAVSGRPDRWTPAPQQHRAEPESTPSRTTAPAPVGTLDTGVKVAPGQLLFAQLTGQDTPAVSRPHRLAVAAYPSLSSSSQIIAPTMSLTRLHTPAPGNNLFDFEI